MMNVKLLHEVGQFKYLGYAHTIDGTSIKKVKLVQAHLAAMTRLAILWKNKAISFPTKIKLYK